METNREEILSKVRDVLTDALGVDDDEVTEEARLMEDLGAESIDVLDIVFRLEKTFGIKIPREEMLPPDDLVNNPDYRDGDRFNEAGVQALKDALPHVDFSTFEQDPQISKTFDLFTVSTIINYVDQKLQAA